MSASSQKFLFLWVTLVLSVTLSAQNNYIVFHPVHKANIVQIYIDRYGNVYPPSDSIDSTKFVNINRKNHEYADIRSYYLKYNTSAYKRVLEEYHVDSFGALQQKLIAECANAVNAQLTKANKLIVLIHGFNEYAALPYDTLEGLIRKHPGAQKAVFLEVYWDGLKAYTENPGDVFKIWFRANRTAPYAAMTLRRLFSKINNTDLYIITHSLGACVGTRLLFNTNEARRFPYTEQWWSLPTPHQSSVTLAMLAPAITGKRVFRFIDQTVAPGDWHNYKRVVVGYNKYDYATTKSWRFPLSRMFHSTSLGCNPSEVKRTSRTLSKLYPALQYRPVDFTNAEIRCKPNKIHHISSYTDRRQDFRRFLDETFAR